MPPRSTLRAWFIGAMLGALPSALWFSLFALDGLNRHSISILLALWPTAILMLSTAGNEHTWTAYGVVASAILANMALYALLGRLAWWVSRSLQSRRSSE